MSHMGRLAEPACAIQPQKNKIKKINSLECRFALRKHIMQRRVGSLKGAAQTALASNELPFCHWSTEGLEPSQMNYCFPRMTTQSKFEPLSNLQHISGVGDGGRDDASKNAAQHISQHCLIWSKKRERRLIWCLSRLWPLPVDFPRFNGWLLWPRGL